MDDDPAYRPWGTVTPLFWAGAPTAPAAEVPAPVPEAVRERLAAIADASAAGDPGKAGTLAHRLDEEITAKCGEVHLHTVHIREVRAHLAHLAGDESTALGWYLHTAKLRAAVQGPDHPDTDQATRRVYGLWIAVPDAEARRLGAELLATVSDIHGPQALVARRTQARLDSLAAPAGP
ncbi:hypothetical protein [Streptomyces sp. H27-C3]|uniref:hypothetical protein n=1 Tax=Streptomyces sp. H27-C3 TaxID=3046305 RepID=UPI0024B88B96|nr:hypothetical protein [Streptomyces sp. H27-C3]MDJ0462044.1 hypothetical protein [Streptomyces sp. H27-C3]